jgi:hypothetical protein
MIFRLVLERHGRDTSNGGITAEFTSERHAYG